MNSRTHFLYLLLTTILMAGPSDSPAFSGYIKFDAFYDTQAMIAAREGHYALYPADLEPDSQLNFVSFQSRIRARLAPVPFFSWSVSGYLEGDFFGTGNGFENQFRLRHSVINVTNTTTTVTIGQYWSPLFTELVYPGTVSFNTGAPMQPFARMPQISLTTAISPQLTARIALTMQRDAFQEIGGNEQQIDSGRPGFHAHAWYHNKYVLLGTGLYHKTIQPVAAPSFSALAWTVYGKLSLKDYVFKIKMTEGEDLADHIMLGGFVTTFDTLSGLHRSAPVRSQNLWLDAERQVAGFVIGVFYGQVKNRGLAQALAPAEIINYFSRGSDIKTIFRLAPRISYRYHSFRLAYELEVTTAAYCSDVNTHLIPDGAETQRRNIRSLFAAYLFF